MAEREHQAEIIHKPLWDETVLHCLMTDQQLTLKCGLDNIDYCPMCGERLTEDEE